MTLLGSRAASITSVSINQLFASNFNKDKKLLAFSDNVQDAAHRAGYFSARTYRFNLRAAIQQLVNQEGEGLNLVEFSKRFPEFWLKRMSKEEYIATFLAPNMEWLQDYEFLKNNGTLPEGSQLLELVNKRINWEIFAEYGFNARIGRTLEKTGCSTVYISHELLNKIKKVVLEKIRNEISSLRTIKEQELSSFLAGFFVHLKNMGAIYHSVLNGYIEAGGEVYKISQKHIKWMPNFGPSTRAPAFLTTNPSKERFDCLFKLSRKTWYQQWAEKCLYRLKMLGESNTLNFYLLLLKELVKAGILGVKVKGKDRIWGILPQALLITNEVAQMSCSYCGHKISINASEIDIWQHTPCLRGQCNGKYKLLPDEDNYYGHLYTTGDIQRLFCAEHTGLLKRDEREKLEAAFKARTNRKPWYPNLLSCTPTLEMGIDIGDLSTTIQCTVPPAQANYLQRIGRAGRKNGNALNLTIANARPHDLYFYSDPVKMIQGEVDSPGVFLDASAVLERQFTAYCFDCWVQSGITQDVLPERVGTVLNELEKRKDTGFPFNFLRFVESRQTELFNGFLKLFSGQLSEDAIKHIRVFVYGNQKNEGSFEFKILEGLHRLHKERKSLNTRIKRLHKAIKRIENDPAKDKNFEQEIEELRKEKAGLQRLVRDINSKNIYNYFTDEGLLPNYAFPEQGIILHSIIYRRRQTYTKGEKKYDTFHFEYERAARAGIQELAPANTFYAGGRKVQIDQVDLGVSGIETWRICSECSYMEMEGSQEKKSSCPRCGSVMWSDEGRKMNLLRMRQVFATAPDSQSRILDDSDQRSPEFYNKQLLVNYKDEDITDAYCIEGQDLAFGFAYITKVKFREINFGRLSDEGEEIPVAGDISRRPGFYICKSCGKVRTSKKEFKHSISCRAKDKEDHGQLVDCVHLYREFTSEAIKILLPISSFGASKEKLFSFIAALNLGLKLKFGGKVDHLQTTLHTEPIPGSSLRKLYLVIYDMVPGGTGYLKQLMRSDTFMQVLELALNKLKACTCSQSEDKDGCYKCLYAYHQSWHMSSISRKQAIELLSEILKYRHKLVPTKNLRNIRVDTLLDSFLEQEFLNALQRSHCPEFPVSLSKRLVNGKPGYFLSIGNQKWLIEPQVELDEKDGVTVKSRADFVFYPARALDKIKPIAIFIDGFVYHKDICGLDMAKRMAIRMSRQFYVWSLSSKDIKGFLHPKKNFFFDFFAPENLPIGQNIAKLWNGYGLMGQKYFKNCSSFELLIRFLQNPDKEMWEKMAFVYALSFLNHQDSRDKCKELLEQTLPAHFAESLQDIKGRVIFSIKQSNLISVYITASIPVIQNSKSGIQKSHLDQIRVAGVLLDSDDNRRMSDFEYSWISFLRLYNVFQFLPHAYFVTTTGVEKEYYDNINLEKGSSVNLISTHSFETEQPSETKIKQEWEEVFELVNERILPIVEDLSLKHIPLPEVGYELLSSNGEVCGEAELAWENLKLAFLTKDQKDYAQKFNEMGWMVVFEDNWEELIQVFRKQGQETKL